MIIFAAPLGHAEIRQLQGHLICSLSDELQRAVFICQITLSLIKATHMECGVVITVR